MKTFSHWRNVGRAMLDARRLGSTFSIDTEGLGLAAYRWAYSARRVMVQTWEDSGEFIVEARTPAGTRLRQLTTSPAEALRVLAALDLIPADIAYAADERYGRCVRCKRLARWWDDELGARWVHVDVMAAFRDSHRAEVVGDQRCQNCAPGYDCESGIYTPTNLAEAGPAIAPTQEHPA
jgi:hypothetical protein